MTDQHPPLPPGHAGADAMSERITIRIDKRADGWLAQVFVDGLRVAKQQVTTVDEGERWATEQVASLREVVRQ